MSGETQQEEVTKKQQEDQKEVERVLSKTEAQEQPAKRQDAFVSDIGEEYPGSEQSSEISPTPQELLEMKLANPERELTATQSIILLNHCAKLGEENTAAATDKEVVMVMGNAGAGKSTFLNYLMGARMKLAYPEGLGSPGEQEVVIVDPEGPRAETMPIGHEETSETFMPQIAPDPDNTTRAYCDCPGFADNRGAEINIANALSVNHILQRSGRIKTIFLMNYHDFRGTRGNNVRAMETMCHQIFGGIGNLERHQNAVLLGITQAPLYYREQPFTRDSVRSLMRIRNNTPIRQLLANRMFLYDPLDRGGANSEFWSREHCRAEIAQLSSIPKSEATTLFQTVLIDSDQTKLLKMARQLRTKLVNAFRQGDARALRRDWLLLQRLRVIQHNEVEQIIQGDVLPTLSTEVLKLLGSFKDHANRYNFDLAENQLALLTRLRNALPGVSLDLDLNALRGCLEDCRVQAFLSS